MTEYYFLRTKESNKYVHFDNDGYCLKSIKEGCCLFTLEIAKDWVEVNKDLEYIKLGGKIISVTNN